MKSIIIKSLAAACLALFTNLATAEEVWVYVPSEKEQKSRQIEGDLNIKASRILSSIQDLYPNKDTEIKLYCRSGSRASVAASALLKAGYANVQNVGAISDAKKQRGIE